MENITTKFNQSWLDIQHYWYNASASEILLVIVIFFMIMKVDKALDDIKAIREITERYTDKDG